MIPDDVQGENYWKHYMKYVEECIFNKIFYIDGSAMKKSYNGNTQWQYVDERAQYYNKLCCYRFDINSTRLQKI